ncbi:MAG: hypothetical protein AB9866_12995 [Syntrophobacteraceae bacterium]
MRKGTFVSSTLEKIRQEFDLSYCYVIFERAGPPDKSHLAEVFETLNRLALAILELKTFYDQRRGTVLLVAKFEAGRADSIMEEIVGAGLPMDIAFYGYGSSQPE